MTTGFLVNVAGTPRPQPRPRFVAGRVVSTVAPATRLWRLAVERAVRAAVAGLGAPTPLFRGPVSVTMVFAFLAPPGAPERLGQPHTHRPDVDNLAKLVADVMTRAGVYADDSQIAGGSTSKIWAARAGVTILVEPMDFSAATSAAHLEPAPGWLGA